MNKQDELLAREIGKVGTLGGKLGKLGGGFPGELGGYIGGSLSARFLPTERYQTTLKLNVDPRTLLAKAYSFFQSKGRVLDDKEGGESPYPKISGILGSGFFNMNPAVIHIEIVSIDDQTCTAIFTGAAKEGLIKQRSAEKAVKRIADSFSTYIP